MKSKKDWIKTRQSQRAEAEDMLAGISAPDPGARSADVILHELLVHKVELEMQVEELRRAHEAMEEARDRYLELYEFAPVGYLTLDREGLITEANLTGATLLGVDRIKLVKGRFARFVAAQEQDVWYRLFLNLMQQDYPDRQTCVLELTRGDGSTLHAYLDCQRRLAADDAPILRLTLFDIGKIRVAEMKMPEAVAGLGLAPNSEVPHD